MALINCCECGSEVSDRARACPRCGYPFLESTSLIGKVFCHQYERFVDGVFTKVKWKCFIAYKFIDSSKVKLMVVSNDNTKDFVNHWTNDRKKKKLLKKSSDGIYELSGNKLWLKTISKKGYVNIQSGKAEEDRLILNLQDGESRVYELYKD